MGKPRPTFTIDDLLAELKPSDVPDGVTTRELCRRAGQAPTKTNLSRAARKVFDLIAEEKWEYAGKKATRTIIGGGYMTPAYRPIEGGGD